MLFVDARKRLHDETGTALIDAIVGVFVLAITATAIAFAVTSISSATSRLADVSAQETAVRSALSTLASYPEAVPTVQATEEFTTSARTVAVTRVKIDLGGGRSLIRAVAGKTSAVDCSDIDALSPAAADYDRCIILDREISTAAVIQSGANA